MPGAKFGTSLLAKLAEEKGRQRRRRREKGKGRKGGERREDFSLGSTKPPSTFFSPKLQAPPSLPNDPCLFYQNSNNVLKEPVCLGEKRFPDDKLLGGVQLTLGSPASGLLVLTALG